jgi:hypothetical protein
MQQHLRQQQRHFNIDTADNDSKAVFTGATTVNEGSTALLSVALSGNPNGTRTMNLVSGNTAAITITPATLTFNASNWNIPQAVLMTGVSDANTSAETVTITASGVDLGGATTNVTTVDSTVIAIILTPSGTTVTEGGTSTIDVKLKRRAKSFYHSHTGNQQCRFRLFIHYYINIR